jgi:UDP-glucose 4-epimerase
MKVLVTGGAGFLGAHLARELLARGRDVVVLDDLSGGLRENVPEGAELVVGDICDAELVERLFAQHRFEVVFHLAAYAAEGLSHFIRRYNYTNNVVGSVTLINGAGELPLRETHVPRPEDPYGIAKLAVEQDLAAAFHQFGLEHVIFRPHNLYGAYQSMRDRYRNVVGIFLNQAMQGKPLTIFGDGTQTRAFTCVGDVIAESGWHDGARNQVFNVGGDRAFTVRELAETVLRVTGASSDLRHLPARNEVAHAWSDHARLRAVFGAGADTDLEEGLRRTWAWARSVGPSEQPPFAAIEVEDGLPAIWRDV